MSMTLKEAISIVDEMTQKTASSWSVSPRMLPEGTAFSVKINGNEYTVWPTSSKEELESLIKAHLPWRKNEANKLPEVLSASGDTAASGSDGDSKGGLRQTEPPRTAARRAKSSS
mgnify:CR=1 FL=1